MNPEIEQLKREIQDLKSMLSNSASISYDVESAFRERLKIETFTPLETSAKSASSENQAVSESGSASYSVLKPPDGWEQRTVNGAVHYYPYWT